MDGKKTGLFFGSFNPIHNGHLMMANHLVEFTDLDQIWFVVSPQNPLKEKSGLAPDYDRLEMVRRAIDDDLRFRVSDIEMHLPRPSYTIHTLTYLSEKYPDRHFVLIIGGDNLQYFHKWKNPEQILAHYQLYVYSRPGFEGGEYATHPSIKIVEAPLIEVSSSYIRKALREKHDVRYFLHVAVYQYIMKEGLYQK